MTDGAPVRRPRSRGPVAFGLAAIAVLFVGVFPTRTHFGQRSAIAHAEEQLAVLDEENQRLEDRIDALNTAEEVERIARDQFGMILPGEQPYVVLPPDEVPLPVPRAWPFAGLAEALARPPG